MELFDHGMMLRVDAYGERDALVSVFTRDHGLVRGLAKRAMTSAQRGTYCVGNWVELRWHARLQEHLGNLECELLIPGGSLLLADRLKCYALQSVCALVMLAFHERDPHPRLYDALQSLMESMRFREDWLVDYPRFEALLLAEAGFGLGLEQCIATGTREELRYVSPKSGCAVSAAAGAAYADKLFAYPALLLQEPGWPAEPAAIANALAITGHFLEKWLFATLDKPAPEARARCVAALTAVLNAAMASAPQPGARTPHLQAETA